MSNPFEKLAEATSPGKQLGELGEGMGKAAEGGEKVANLFSNNNNNRILIIFLLSVIVIMAGVWYVTGKSNTVRDTTQQNKIDLGKEEIIQVYKDLHKEDTAKIRQKDDEIKELRIMVTQGTETIKRQNNAIDILKSQQK